MDEGERMKKRILVTTYYRMEVPRNFVAGQNLLLFFLFSFSFSFFCWFGLVCEVNRNVRRKKKVIILASTSPATEISRPNTNLRAHYYFFLLLFFPLSLSRAKTWILQTVEFEVVQVLRILPG